MVDPIKTNTQLPVASKLSTQPDSVRPSASFAAPASATTPSQKPPAIQEPPKPKGDTVELSQAAQARLLHMQGMSIPDIAMQLKLDITTVNSFFPKE